MTGMLAFWIVGFLLLAMALNEDVRQPTGKIRIKAPIRDFAITIVLVNEASDKTGACHRIC